MDCPLAIISDIHGNREALDAVLGEIRQVEARAVICLGDVVGYGASPEYCTNVLREMECPVTIGNHDFMTLADVDVNDFRADVAGGIQLAREQMSAESRAYLQRQFLVLEDENLQLVHSSLHDPEVFRYILGVRECREHFEEQRRPVCFVGHTHRPAIWRRGPKGGVKRLRVDVSVQLELDQQHVVNVGSVGQPRDGDPRACFVLYEPESGVLEYRRIAYDIDKSAARIHEEGLHPVCAERLFLGR